MAFILYRYIMNYYKSLLHRVRVLERYFIESKKDQEILQSFLGDEYYDKYNAVKNKINDPEYKDIYRLIKKDPEEVKQFIDSIQSNRDIRTAKKTEGAELIYNKDGWKVYKITTYPAAQLYGSGTKWCITGRYAGHEERGEQYFYEYIDEYNLDGGYYFYIHGNDKYCILKRTDGSIADIYDAADNPMTKGELYDAEPSLPTVPGIGLDKNGDLLYSNNIEDVKRAIATGIDVNSRASDYTSTPLSYHCSFGNMDIIKLLLDSGANPDIQMPILTATLNRNSDVLEVLLDAGANANVSANVGNIGYTSALGLAINQVGRFADKRSELCAQLLIEHGADPNARVGKGNAPTPIWYAVEEILHSNAIRYNIIKALLNAGADCKKKRAGETLIEHLEQAANSFSSIKRDSRLIKLLSKYM